MREKLFFHPKNLLYFPLVIRLHESSNNLLENCFCCHGRHGVANLLQCLSPRPHEGEIARKCLQAGEFANSKRAQAGRVVIVPPTGGDQIMNLIISVVGAAGQVVRLGAMMPIVGGNIFDGGGDGGRIVKVGEGWEGGEGFTGSGTRWN